MKKLHKRRILYHKQVFKFSENLEMEMDVNLVLIIPTKLAIENVEMMQANQQNHG